MRITLTTILFMLLPPVMLAQTSGSSAKEIDTCLKHTVLENSFIEAAIGGQVLYSQDVENLSTSNRITPSLSIAAGKWINPIAGASIKIQGFSLNGFSTTEGTYTAGQGSSIYEQDPVRKEVTINPDGTYRHFIRYINTSVNVFVSLVNLYSLTPGEKKFDLIPSVGIGNMHVFNYKGIPRNNRISYNLGLTAQYQVNSVLAFNSAFNIVYFNNDFEGRIAGSLKKEKYASANFGVVYYLKGRNLKPK